MKELIYITARGNRATLRERGKASDGFTTYHETEENQPDLTFTARRGFVKAKHDLMCFFNKDKIISTAKK